MKHVALPITLVPAALALALVPALPAAPAAAAAQEPTTRATAGAAGSEAPARPAGDPAADERLLTAAQAGDAAGVAAALEAGADPRARIEGGASALHRAAASASLEAVDRLHAAGAEHNARDARQGTPLHVVGTNREGAASREIGATLLAAGADLEARDAEGRTPLHAAAFAGDPPLVELLLARGAELDAPDGSATTPLHLAVQAVLLVDRVALRMGNNEASRPIREAIEVLLAAGADPSAPDEEGVTPLHHAARYGHRGMVDRLLAAGADRTAEDNRGRTPAEYVEASPEIAELLAVPPAAEGESAEQSP